MKTITFKITGMHCTSCAINIDFEVEDLNGVQQARTNYVKQTAEVIFDPDKVTTDNIISVIKKLGYEAIVS